MIDELRMLERNTYFIREHVGFMKVLNTYDILDPETQEQIGIAKEEPPSIVSVLKIFMNDKLLPTTINVYEDENSPPVFSIEKHLSFFTSRVDVIDATGELLGFLKSKMFSFGGGFWVHDAQGNQFAEVKGDWRGWNFKFLNNNKEEMGIITKKWAGIGKELFTSADNYIVSLNDSMVADETGNILLLAAALAVDTIYKENA